MERFNFAGKGETRGQEVTTRARTVEIFRGKYGLAEHDGNGEYRYTRVPRISGMGGGFDRSVDFRRGLYYMRSRHKSGAGIFVDLNWI